jgi:hypothetical protein
MSQGTNQDQEIDLSVISKKIAGYIDQIGLKIFRSIEFAKKNIITIVAIIVIGFVLGYFLDRNNENYTSEIIVIPNFGSTDDLYAKVDLLQSKIAEKDTSYLRKIGFTDFKKIGIIEIEPIIDVYSFVSNNTAVATNAQNTQNFEVVKLLAEDSDINKVLKDKITSKNYTYHLIKISSIGKVLEKKNIQPILNFLNANDYFIKIQKTYIENIKQKMVQNQAIINQIDGLLNQFSTTSSNNQKSDKLVYYNENSQLNDIIATKNNLITELGSQRIQLVNLDKIVKPSSIVLNEKNKKGLNGKMSKILPILFLFLFFGFVFTRNLYKKQQLKYA